MMNMFFNANSFFKDISNWNIKSNGITSNMFSGAVSMDKYKIFETFSDSPSYLFFQIYTPLTNNKDNTNIFAVFSQWMYDSKLPQFTNYKNNPYFGPIEHWNTYFVQVMDNLFQDASGFNEDISNWNTSSLISAKNMFQTRSQSVYSTMEYSDDCL